jgi:hypothetical protein
MQRFFGLAFALLLFVGCSSSKRAVLSGKVTYKGQPVNGVMLHFYPASSDAGKETADLLIPVTQEGTFSTTGVKAGEYKIVIETRQVDDMASKLKNMKGPKADEAKKKLQESQAGAEKPTIDFPKKYQNILSSDLTCKITGGPQELILELK